MKVQEIMTTKIERVSPDDAIKKAAVTMCNMDVGTLLVIDNEQMVGVLTDRDICCRVVAEGRNPARTRVAEVMSQDVFHCFGDQEITEAARIMEEKHVHRLAVLNHDSKMAGFLSIDDLAHGSHELAGEVLDSAAVTH